MEISTDNAKDAEPRDTAAPRVSLGLPVYNGENYLPEALACILSQTFEDFELVISDNASDDRTEEICRAAAERDPRVRYFRQERNLGAAANYNFVFARSRGAFFKWCAHDDLIGESFIETCLSALDADPSVVGAFSKDIRKIDASGEVVETLQYDLDPAGAGPAERFCHYLDQPNLECCVFFALFRREPLSRTSLHGDYIGSDRVFVGEVLLLGRLVLVEGSHFLFRTHAAQFSSRAWGAEDFALAWLNPDRKPGISLRSFRFVAGYMAAVSRAPLSLRQRVRAYRAVGRLGWRLRNRMIKDLLVPFFRNGRVTPTGAKLRSWLGRR